MMNGNPRIYYLLVRFRIPAAASLKDKRSVIQPILVRARNLGFSAAELNHHDRIREGYLGFAGIHHDAAQFTDSVNKLKRMFEESDAMVLCGHREDYVDFSDNADSVDENSSTLARCSLPAEKEKSIGDDIP